MPIAKFELPDGRIAKFEVVEGTTPEQAQAQIEQFLQSQQASVDTPVSADVSGMTFRPLGIDTGLELPEALGAGLVGAGRGLTTIGRGLGLADPEEPSVTRQFEQLREQQPIATTVGEVVGEAAPFLIPGTGLAKIASTGGRVAGAVGLGAAEGGLITRGQGRDVGQQLSSAGIGGSVAGALELGLPIIGRAGSKIIRRVRGKAPEGAVIDATGQPSQEFLDALQESGQTFDDVIVETQEELSKKALDPRESARKAFFESQGIAPTRAQITRNAADFQTQQEAAKTSSRVRDALEQQEAILTTRFNDAVLETGGRANTATSSIVDSLTEKATRLDQEIGDLYNAAREVVPGDKNVKFDALTAKLKQLAPSDRRSGGNIRAIVGDMQSKGILDDNMKVVGRVNVETAEDLRKLTNELFDPANPFGNMLLRQVKDELDDDVFRAAGNDFFQEGRKAKAAFEKELNRAKISKFDSRKDNLVRDVLENKIDPDQLVDKVVFGKRWRPTDLQQLKSYVSTDDVGKSAFNDLRAEVLESIKSKSFIGPVDSDGFQALSRAKLQSSLSKIGQKKLNILFTGEEQKFLKDMLEITRLREPVRGTALGRGPSAQAIGRVEQKLKDLPVIGSLINILNVDAQGRAVIKAKPRPIPPQALTGSQARQAATALTIPALTAQQEQQ